MVMRSSRPSARMRSRASAGLLFRQRDAVADDADNASPHRCSIAPQPQPMSSKRVARLQPQLAADVLELVGLRLVDGCWRIGEIGAGVDHPLVEEEPVERIRYVVVMLDRFLVGAADERVAPAQARRGCFDLARKASAGRSRSSCSFGKVLSFGLELALGAQCDDVEQRAALDIDRLGHPELDQGGQRSAGWLVWPIASLSIDPEQRATRPDRCARRSRARRRSRASAFR